MNLLWNFSKQMVNYILLKEETHYKINHVIITTYISHFARIFFSRPKQNKKLCKCEETISVIMWWYNVQQTFIILGSIHKWRHPLTGEGDLPKGDVTPQAFLVKWVTRVRRGSQKSQKMGDIIYGWPLIYLPAIHKFASCLNSIAWRSYNKSFNKSNILIVKYV